MEFYWNSVWPKSYRTWKIIWRTWCVSSLSSKLTGLVCGLAGGGVISYSHWPTDSLPRDVNGDKFHSYKYAKGYLVPPFSIVSFFLMLPCLVVLSPIFFIISACDGRLHLFIPDFIEVLFIAVKETARGIAFLVAVVFMIPVTVAHLLTYLFSWQTRKEEENAKAIVMDAIFSVSKLKNIDYQEKLVVWGHMRDKNWSLMDFFRGQVKLYTYKIGCKEYTVAILPTINNRPFRVVLGETSDKNTKKEIEAFRHLGLVKFEKHECPPYSVQLKYDFNKINNSHHQFFELCAEENSYVNPFVVKAYVRGAAKGIVVPKSVEKLIVKFSRAVDISISMHPKQAVVYAPFLPKYYELEGRRSDDNSKCVSPWRARLNYSEEKSSLKIKKMTFIENEDERKTYLLLNQDGQIYYKKSGIFKPCTIDKDENKVVQFKKICLDRAYEDKESPVCGLALSFEGKLYYLKKNDFSEYDRSKYDRDDLGIKIESMTYLSKILGNDYNVIDVYAGSLGRTYFIITEKKSVRNVFQLEMFTTINDDASLKIELSGMKMPDNKLVCYAICASKDFVLALAKAKTCTKTNYYLLYKNQNRLLLGEKNKANFEFNRLPFSFAGGSLDESTKLVLKSWDENAFYLGHNGSWHLITGQDFPNQNKPIDLVPIQGNENTLESQRIKLDPLLVGKDVIYNEECLIEKQENEITAEVVYKII